MSGRSARNLAIAGGRATSLRPCARSHSAGDNVAVNLSPEANENNAVTGGISFVPFQLVSGHGDFCPVRNDSLSIRDDGHVMILFYLEEVSLVCVGLATARCSRVT